MEAFFHIHENKFTDFFDIGAVRQYLCSCRGDVIGGDIVTYLNHDPLVNAIRKRRIDRQRLDIRTAHNIGFCSCFCIRNDNHGIIDGKGLRLLRQLIAHSTRIYNITMQCTCGCSFRGNQTYLGTQRTASSIEIPVEGTKGERIGDR